VGPRAGLDDVENRKFLTIPALELRTLGRPADSSRYTDYAIPAPMKNKGETKEWSRKRNKNNDYRVEVINGYVHFMLLVLLKNFRPTSLELFNWKSISYDK
jgi:hypothetical protein